MPDQLSDRRPELDHSQEIKMPPFIAAAPINGTGVGGFQLVAGNPPVVLDLGRGTLIRATTDGVTITNLTGTAHTKSVMLQAVGTDVYFTVDHSPPLTTGSAGLQFQYLR